MGNSKSPILNIILWKFYGLVLGLVELIDVKGIDVAQPIWQWAYVESMLDSLTAIWVKPQ